jgi:hypothetical protein
MKKKSAIFTIVKDETYYLHKWLNYYSQFFNKEDIYILDHQTKDGSTDNLDCNVIEIINEVAFDHLWLVQQVENFQKNLLEKYEVVIFTEVDEILYSLNQSFDSFVEDFRLNNNLSYLSAIGYEIKQDTNHEKSLTQSDNILENRNYWFRYNNYDKTLITKIPLSYGVGFHDCQYPKLQSSLFLLHLHRVDLNLMIERRQKRATTWNLKQDDIKKGWGVYHSEGETEQIKHNFNHYHTGHPILVELIPQEHKNSIYGL